MNKDTEDQILTTVLRDKNEQPPKALDDLILNAAKSSHQNNAAVHEPRSSWRAWLAAASVVLVMPLVWLMTQNNELTQAPAPETTIQELQSTNKVAAEIQNGIADDVDQEAAFNEEKTTVSVSRMRSAPAAEAPTPVPSDYMAEFEADIKQESKRSITGKPIDYESLATNKALLKDELKAKKRTIKPSNMDPLMALEYAQFGRYLEEGEFDLADELLTEMQANWPDFDFEDMIYRLAEAEAGSG